MDDHTPIPAETETSSSWAPPAVSNNGSSVTNGAASSAARPAEPEIVVPASPAPSGGERAGTEQLARIEDKTSRIEEKFARSEAAMQRVVDRFDSASGRMSEVASQAELAAVRGEVAFIARRVRTLPGNAALAATALATAVLTAIVTIAILKYVPGLLAR